MIDPENRLKELEEISGALEPNAEERKIVRDKIIAYTENYLENIEDLPAWDTSIERAKEVVNFPVQDEPRPVGEIVDLFDKSIERPALRASSGGHLGYIPGGGLYYSAMGDVLADISNKYAGVYFAGPGAVRMENMLLGWMADIFGYPETFAGNHTSGGSIANLIAMVTARDAREIKSRDIEKTVIYASAHMHHCLNKAIRIAGLSECVLHNIDLDDEYRMQPEALRKQVEADKAAGLNPFMIIGSAGTTDMGAVDPLNDLADIAETHDMWFHVDGAYGGFFMMVEEGRRRLKGIERSDSLVVDPHKGLFLPYGSGAVLVKNGRYLRESHHYLANYMQDTLVAQDEISPADLSPELTKHFRGMRLWFPLMLHGLKPFKAALEEKMLLAQYFHREVQKIPNFEVGPKPQLSVMTYRYNDGSDEATLERKNQELVEHVREDGRVFISSTNVSGKFVLRLAVLSFRTKKKTIDDLLDVLSMWKR